MKLPPANTTPLDRRARRRQLGRARRRVLESLVGDEAVYYVQRTRTKVDVGGWFRKGRVCICLLANEAVILAKGKRPYVERIPLQRLRESQYNHVTGELMLAPDGATQISGLKVPPLEGLQILAQIHQTSPAHTLECDDSSSL
jgi:hypothetical protein